MSFRSFVVLDKTSVQALKKNKEDESELDRNNANRTRTRNWIIKIPIYQILLSNLRSNLKA